MEQRPFETFIFHFQWWLTIRQKPGERQAKYFIEIENMVYHDDPLRQVGNSDNDSNNSV